MAEVAGSPGGGVPWDGPDRPGLNVEARVSALLWWLIPIGATLIALGWAALRSRPRRTVDTHESVTGMMRFTEAMRRPLPEGAPAPDQRRSSSATRRAPAPRPARTRPPRRSSSAGTRNYRDPGRGSRDPGRRPPGHSTA